MAIRVVARIRPQQSHELEKDVIVSTASNHRNEPTFVKVPNPKNEGEDFTFQFSSVYDHTATQQRLFDNEISPTVKHLFNGFDVTIFAYGSTGTGKTHTMRGGKTLAERGVIPRLLSAIYRRARKTIAGETTVELSFSYYEIYNDKVFDLFEAPEKRTMAGLPLRESGGKTTVVGLTERPCESLKEFEMLYDRANINRSTSATKLNAASSRSHAILGIKLAVCTGDEVRISTASAIDLAGSEDNRRTENGKERMIESASINKSLFTLAKCVEAISTDSSRIPYRESKMTRILSLGQNNGLTVMILNLAPTRSYHLDTISSLNFANRTKRIEVREIENERVFKACPRTMSGPAGSSIQRQPLRPLSSTVHNASNLHASNPAQRQGDKQAKSFFVYADKLRYSNAANRPPRGEPPRRSSPLKRPFTSDTFVASVPRPHKRRSPNRLMSKIQPVMSKEAIESIIEKKVTDILTARALDQPPIAPQVEISEEVQRRLDVLEQKIDGKDDGREQGLTFLLMAKQHAVRGEDTSALRMYTLAKEYFPENKKLDMKIEKLHEKLQEKKQGDVLKERVNDQHVAKSALSDVKKKVFQATEEDDDYRAEEIDVQEYESDVGFHYKAKVKKPRVQTGHCASAELEITGIQTPRTKQLLEIVNTRDVNKIRLLRGVGAKKGEAILEALGVGGEDDADSVQSLGQLGRLRGVGAKTVENMRIGLQSGLSVI